MSATILIIGPPKCGATTLATSLNTKVDIRTSFDGTEDVLLYAELLKYNELYVHVSIAQYLRDIRPLLGRFYFLHIKADENRAWTDCGWFSIDITDRSFGLQPVKRRTCQRRWDHRRRRRERLEHIPINVDPSLDYEIVTAFLDN